MLNRLDFRQLDLNLFPKFCAVYTKRSVSAAARDLFVTQSGISNALARMRDVFGDDLFVRTSDGMAPTPLADEVFALVSPALENIEAGLREAGTFDPAQSDRPFAFATSSGAEWAVVPELFAALRTAAPHIALSTASADGETVAMDMRTRAVDFAIGSFASLEAGFDRAVLAATEFVGIVRAGNPALNGGAASLRDLEYVEADDCVPAQPELPHMTLRSRVRTGSVWATPFVVAASDLAAIVPVAVASRLEQALDIVRFADPFTRSITELYLYWDTRREREPAIRWMRDFLTQVPSAMRKAA